MSSLSPLHSTFEPRSKISIYLPTKKIISHAHFECDVGHDNRQICFLQLCRIRIHHSHIVKPAIQHICQHCTNAKTINDICVTCICFRPYQRVIATNRYKQTTRSLILYTNSFIIQCVPKNLEKYQHVFAKLLQLFEIILHRRKR